MADLILLPTLERLHPHDTAANLDAYGLTLSVALGEGKTKLSDLGPGEAFGRSLLQPWTWKPDSRIEPGDGDLVVEIIEILFYAAADLTQPVKFKRLRIKHEDRIAAMDAPLKARFNAFEELERVGGTPWSWARERLAVNQESRPWPGFVGQLSQYPYPVPQALRLSFFLELDEDLGAAVAAAPILRFRQNGKIIEVIPQPPVLFADRLRLEYKWPDPEPPQPADPAAPPPPPASEPVRLALEAQTVACATTIPLSSTFFDFKDLWIKTEAAKNITNAEWRSGLESRVAEQLHLTRTIVDWMKDNPSNPELIAKYPKVAWSAIQKLRLVLGPGLRKGPEGSFLKRASSFLEQFPQPFPDSAIEALRQTALDFFKSPDDPEEPDPVWAGWLREAISGLKGEAARSGLLDAAVEEDPVGAIGSLLTFDQARAELDQLLASVAEPETLRTLLKLQWAALVEARFQPPGGSNEEKLARALAAGLPKEVDVQRLLLFDHLDRHWETLTKAFAGSPELDAARKKLQEQYMEVLKTEKIPLVSDADLKPLAERFLQRVLPQELDKVEPRGTRGVTFQLDTLGQDDQDDNDLLQNMQGVALLMRRESETGYHCLNLAAARIGDTVIDPVLIPSRLAYVNDLRSPTVTYDNGPLTVAGPLGAAAVAGAELYDREKGPIKPIDEPLIELTYSSKGRIPGLIFNKNYQVLPFLVTNSGAIPKELVESGKPWKLRDPIPQLSRTPVEKKYLREAHIGALRFGSGDASGLPPIPANVAPQIRELPQEKVLPPGDPLVNKDKDLKTDSALAGMPLLLLTPTNFPRRPGIGLQNQFKFQISPPTIDLQTWDRWVAADFAGETGKNRRKFVWRSFYQLAHDKGLADRKLEEAGVYLDDPAVAGIWAELAGIGQDGTRASLGIQKFDRVPKPPPFKPANPIKPDFSNWKEADCTLLTEQHASILVDCLLEGGLLTVKLGPAGAVPKTLSGTGRLFCLSFYAFMKDEDEARFSEKEHVRTEVSPKGTSPWHLLIEIPQVLPRTATLRTALRSSLKPSFADGTLKVNLNMNDMSELHGHVYRAELMHQVWSWGGRPPADHPDLVTQQDREKALLAFHMSEFGERSDDEHRLLPLPRLAPKQPVPDPVFQYEEALASEGPEGELRALAHRFSARVSSRWEGILPEGESHLEAEDEATRDRWKPLFVPCRRRHEVPPPKVKLVLPLTQGFSEKQTEGPGLLVVVDGTWYEVGGLAERLEAEVMEVLDPKADPNVPDPKPKYFQIGTDPIVTGKSIGKLLNAGEALSTEGNKITFKVDGAVGHHRDHSQTAPRFLASSFLLSRPAIRLKNSQQDADVDLSWCFLKLRFFRKLQVQDGKQVFSEPSAPFWVQILPGVERVEEEWFGSRGNLDVSLSGRTLSVSSVEPNRVTAGPPFQLFAVMTRKVIDFAGRPDQEAYLGVWSWNASTRIWSPTQDMIWGSEKDLYIRFIEVQSRNVQAITRGDELWGRIFNADQKDSDRARIVRISNRFCVNERCL